MFVTFIARDDQFCHKVFVKQKSMAEKEDVKVNVKLKETDICLKSAIKFHQGFLFSCTVRVLLLKRDNKIVIKFPRFRIVHRQFERRNVSNQEIMIRIEQLSSTETEGWYLDIWKLWLCGSKFRDVVHGPVTWLTRFPRGINFPPPIISIQLWRGIKELKDYSFIVRDFNLFFNQISFFVWPNCWPLLIRIK